MVKFNRPGKSKNRWVIFAIFSSLYFLAYFFRTSTAVVAEDIMTDLFLGASILGLMSSAFFYSYAVAQTPVGILADKLGPRWTITIFASIAFCGCILFALASNVIWLSLGRALMGFGSGGIFVPTQKLFTRWFSPREFASVNGLLISIGNVGALVSTAPLAWLVSSVGWRFSFVVMALLLATLLIFSWLLERDSSSRSFGPERIAAFSSGEKTKGELSILQGFLRNRDFLLLFPIAFLIYGVVMAYQGLWGGPFLMDVYGLSRSQAGSALMMIGIGVVIGCPLGGIVSDRTGRRKKIFQAGLLGMVLFWAPVAIWVGTLPIFWIYLLGFFLGIANGFYLVYQTIAKESFSPKMLATGLATLNIAPFLGAALFQSFTGYIVEIRGKMTNGYTPEAYQTVFLAYLFALLFALLLSCFVRGDRGEKRSGRN